MFESALPWFQAPTSGELPDSSIELVAACLAGDESAYAALYSQFSGPLYRLSYSLLQNKEDAEEVLQDSFEYAFRRLDRFDPGRSALKSWLFRIAICRCRNKRRRKWLPAFPISHFRPEEVVDQESHSPDELADQAGRHQAIWNALGQLSPRLRETTVLRYYDGLSYVEIGSILAIPPKTAESRMRLAHKALRDLLAEELG